MTSNAEALQNALLAYYRHKHMLNAPPGMADAVITHRALADTRSTLAALNSALSAAELQLVDRSVLTQLHTALQHHADKQSRELCGILAELLARGECIVATEPDDTGREARNQQHHGTRQ